jgi:hypothetical protein
MARFYEDPRSPIVAELIRQDFNFEEPEALRLIDMDEQSHHTDGTIALGTGAACIAATAGTLALSGFTLPILLPAIGIGVSGVTYWNSKVTARNREMETQFLSDHPEVLVKVISKINAGENRDTIAAAFEQCLRAYRWGDMAQMARVLGTSPAMAPIANPGTVIDYGTKPSTAQTELQPIAPGNAAAPSMVHSKVLCPIEVLGRDPYQSMGVIGGQRTGKTYTAALHTQNVKRNLGAKIIYINLMDANGDAADDWSHADVCVTCHLRKLAPNKAKAMIEHVTSVVNDFFNDLNQILVFDEWVGFTSKANQWPKKASQDAAAAAIESREAKTYIEPEGLGTSAIELMNLVMAVTGELCQSGKKQAKAIWLLSPMVKAGAMEPQGLVIKEVQPMVIAISKERSVSWKHPVTGLTQEIGFDDAGYRASIPNMGLPTIESIPKMDCARMLYVKGTWYSLDNLPALEKSAPSIAPPSPSIAPSSSSSEPTGDEWKAYQEIPQQTPIETTPKKENFDGWADYPIHQAVLKYLADKDGKTDRDIYDSIRRRRSDSDWADLPGDDNISKLRGVLKFLSYKGKISATSEGIYSGLS